MTDSSTPTPNSKNIWDKQEWESTFAFNAFSNYYLRQTSPRRVSVAWYSYVKDKFPEQEHDRRLRKTSNRWALWSQGKDHDGKPIPGAVSWQKRAEAYDSRVNSQRMEAQMSAKSEEKERRLNMLRHQQELYDTFMANINPKDAKAVQQAFNMFNGLMEQSRREFNDLPTTKQDQTIRDGGKLKGYVNFSPEEWDKESDEPT